MAGPVMRESWGAPPGAAVDGVDAAISAWTADLCGKTLGREVSRGDKQRCAPLVRAAQERELAAWKEFNKFDLVAESTVRKSLVDTRWGLT